MGNIKKLRELPKTLRIHTLKNKKTGVWVAHLVAYDICTEADSFYELVFNVNDLIYAYFDVPKRLQSKVTYLPAPLMEKLKPTASPLQKNMTFNILVSPQLLHGYRNA